MDIINQINHKPDLGKKLLENTTNNNFFKIEQLN